jgi:hypothetical protein
LRQEEFCREKERAMAIIAYKSQGFPVQVSGWIKSLNLLGVGEGAARRIPPFSPGIRPGVDSKGVK